MLIANQPLLCNGYRKLLNSAT